MLNFNEILKFLKEIRLRLPIYIIRRVNNTLLGNGGKSVTGFVNDNIKKDVVINEKQRNVRKNYRKK